MDRRAERSEEFTEQLRACHRQVFGYLFALLRNLENTQDVFQQTCVVLWDRFDEFTLGTNFAAWACKVAQFKAREFLKSRRRYEAHLSEAFALRLASVQAEVTADELDVRQEALAGCVEKLSAPQRRLLDGCYGGELDVAGFAKQFGRPVRSVYNSLRRIRETLLDCVERTLAMDARTGEARARALEPGVFGQGRRDHEL